MSFATADLYDEHGDDLQVVHPMFNHYGALSKFHGQVVTLKVHEDNTLVRAALEEPGEGRVLVVDGGGSLRCALVGDMLAELGIRNAWAGIIVYGCIRDSAVIEEMQIGIKALNTNPKKSVKKGVGERDILIRFGEVAFAPGDYVYADKDGIVVSHEKLI